MRLRRGGKRTEKNTSPTYMLAQLDNQQHLGKFWLVIFSSGSSHSANTVAITSSSGHSSAATSDFFQLITADCSWEKIVFPLSLSFAINVITSKLYSMSIYLCFSPASLEFRACMSYHEACGREKCHRKKQFIKMAS